MCSSSISMGEEIVRDSAKMKKRTLEMVGVLSAVMLVLIFGCDIDPMASVRKAVEQGGCGCAAQTRLVL